MYKKVLTKDCPSCKKMEINDEGYFQCNWGRAKKPKILDTPKSGMKQCRLKK